MKKWEKIKMIMGGRLMEIRLQYLIRLIKLHHSLWIIKMIMKVLVKNLKISKIRIMDYFLFHFLRIC